MTIAASSPPFLAVRGHFRCCPAPVNQEAQPAQQQIGHSNHKKYAVVVSTGFAKRIIFLRTGGGCDRLLSHGTGGHSARSRQTYRHHANDNK